MARGSGAAPWRPLPGGAILLACVVAFIVPFAFPAATAFIEVGPWVPRPIPPSELSSVLLSVFLTVCCFSRLSFIDTMVTTRVRARAVWITSGILAVSVGIGMLSLLGYPPWGEPGAHIVARCLNNSAVMASICVVLCAFLGRALGSIATLAAYVGLILAQNQGIALGSLPLNFGHLPSGMVDTEVRWAWIVALFAAAVISAWASGLVGGRGWKVFSSEPWATARSPVPRRVDDVAT